MAHDSSVIYFLGIDFAIDGEPVPYGPVDVPYGTITGQLAPGEYLFTGFGGVQFYQNFAPEAPCPQLPGRPEAPCTGRVVLAEAPPALPATLPELRWLIPVILGMGSLLRLRSR